MTPVYELQHLTLPTSLLDPASGALPAQLWVCGCREDRGTGKNLGHPLGHQDAAVGMTVVTGKSQPYGVSPMLPGGAGRHGIPMHYSAVLHHKSQLACTKRC